MAEEKQYTREELEDILTDKEKKYCEEYVIDWNKARAARAAGYSEEWARSIGYQNATKIHIKQYIEFIKNELERLSGVSKLRNVMELSKIAFSSIAHLHNTWIELKDFEELTEDQKSAIESIDTKTVTINFDEQTKQVEYVKIKLYSKSDAIKTINEMMGYKAADKIEHSGTIQTVDLAQLSTEELLLRANATNKLKEK